MYMALSEQVNWQTHKQLVKWDHSSLRFMVNTDQLDNTMGGFCEERSIERVGNSPPLDVYSYVNTEISIHIEFFSTEVICALSSMSFIFL